MAKINDKDIYNLVGIPKLLDFLIGSLKEDGSTKNFTIQSIIELINGSNGINNVQFQFSNGADQEVTFETEGRFFTDTNALIVNNFTKLIFNKKTFSNIDLSSLFNKIGITNNILLKLVNPSNPNNIFIFKVTAFENFTEHFKFMVQPYNNFYLGSIVNNEIYSLYFDLSTPDQTFTTDLTVSLAGTKTAGRYVSGQTIPRIGKTNQEVMDDMYRETLVPTLTAPSLGVLTLNQTSPKEVGAILSTVQATATFSRGSILPQYSALNAFRSGLSIRHIYTGPGGFTGVQGTNSNAVSRTINNYPVALGNNVFALAVGYDLGAQPKDSIGGNFNTPLPSGEISNIATLAGAYLNFFGSVLPSDHLSEDSASVRALTNNTFGNTFSIIIPSGQTKISFAYPATKPNITDSSVKYVQGFNSNVGNTFTLNIFNVNDAGGNPVSYKVYTATLPAASASSITYNVTLQ